MRRPIHVAAASVLSLACAVSCGGGTGGSGGSCSSPALQREFDASFTKGSSNVSEVGFLFEEPSGVLQPDTSPDHMTIYMHEDILGSLDDCTEYSIGLDFYPPPTAPKKYTAVTKGGADGTAVVTYSETCKSHGGGAAEWIGSAGTVTVTLSQCGFVSFTIDAITMDPSGAAGNAAMGSLGMSGTGTGVPVLGLDKYP